MSSKSQAGEKFYTQASPIKVVLSFFSNELLIELANNDYMLAFKNADSLQNPELLEKLCNNIKARPQPFKSRLSKLNKPGLKQICKELELKRSGKKADLIARIAGRIEDYIETAGKPKKEEVGIIEERRGKQRTKLELIWPSKDKMLIYDYGDDGKPIPEFRNRGELEPRVLVDIEQIGEEKGQEYNPERSNLLIKGDNLFALKALERDFAGKIKLIYIDPPFNTGAAFEHYDDGLEHSTWLSMMRDRLRLLKKLLREDGAIFVHIDDHENAYLTVLLDEIFGKRNFITTITVKKSATTGHKAINPTPVNVNEFIHGYAKNRNKWEYIRMEVPRNDYDWMYNQVIKNPDDPPRKWEFVNLSNATAHSLGFDSAKALRGVLKDIADQTADGLGISSSDLYRNLKEYFKQQQVEYALNNSQRVIRFARIAYNGVSKEAQKLIDKSVEEGGRIHHLPRDEYPDMFIKGKDRILWLEDKIGEVNGRKTLVEPLTNIWDDISWQGIANEGNVVLRKGKKPEALLKRIIEISTCPGDIVLDNFAGSGTTGAVAHKMDRRWIMVELGKHAETHALKRLKGVISGEDQTGISEAVDWNGGGGFHYCVLGERLLKKDLDLGKYVLNPNYSNGPLVHAVCAYEGFTLTGDGILHGKSGETFAHVTEDYLTQAHIDELSKTIEPSESLIIYAPKFSSQIELPTNLEIKKIPRDLKTRYIS